jgi:hypothetical protein
MYFITWNPDGEGVRLFDDSTFEKEAAETITRALNDFFPHYHYGIRAAQ